MKIFIERLTQMLEFTKMQGCGNDYIYINCLDGIPFDPSELSKELSKRGLSVGADGIILICSSEIADCKMRIFNADGSEGKMCGNGVRCVGKYVYDKNIVRKKEITVETLSGIKYLTMIESGDKTSYLAVDMGKANLSPESLPVKLDGDTVIGRDVLIEDETYNITCVSMGNPHCVVFTDNVSDLDIKTSGRKFEFSPLFPESVNTEFVKVTGKNEIEMRVWERGSGETLACGTGACAAAVASVLHGYCDKNTDIKVKLLGGDLIINYSDDRVMMTGPAQTVYEGKIY